MISIRIEETKNFYFQTQYFSIEMIELITMYKILDIGPRIIELIILRSFVWIHLDSIIIL